MGFDCNLLPGWIVNVLLQCQVYFYRRVTSFLLSNFLEEWYHFYPDFCTLHQSNWKEMILPWYCWWIGKVIRWLETLVTPSGICKHHTSSQRIILYFVIYRWLYIPHTSANPVIRTQRDQPNWTVTEFKEDCSRERLCDFWQSRRGQLHVFCSFRAAWCRKRNEDVSWRDTANCDPLSYEPPYAGKLNRSTNLSLWKVFC